MVGTVIIWAILFPEKKFIAMFIKNKKVPDLFLLLLVSLLIIICFFSPGYTEEKTEDYPVTPVKNGEKKWRIGYLEGGDYNEYHTSMDATIKGLMELGWINEQKLPALEGVTGGSLWEYYSKNLKSDYLEFVSDGFYSAEWNPDKREKNRTEFILRLNQKRDIDLVIAMGTWAGIDLSQGGHQTPTIVLAVSDAVYSKIIHSIHDSGNAYIHARVDPDRYERQIQIFHTLIGFKTLGIIYRDDIEGRSYAAIDKIMKVARERGFTIQRCFLDNAAELVSDEKRLIQCFRELTNSADAIYVTAQKAVNPNTIPILAAIAKEAKIPTFSQSGYEDVQKGLLLSISQAGFKYVGAFYARTMAKILNGAMPGDLNQIFEDPSKIALNLSTAEAIEFYPTLDVLSSADEIYREIEDETKP